MNDQEKLIYLAGFIDGEGSIAVGINRSNKGVRRWYLRFSVHQLNPKPLKILSELFGGSVRYHGYGKKPGQRQLYEWVITSLQAAVAIRALRPYLIVKADEADVGLRFQDLVSINPPGLRPHLTTEQEEARNNCYLELRALKQRLYSPELINEEFPRVKPRASNSGT